jgi:nucleoside-triphosphatase THEP1
MELHSECFKEAVKKAVVSRKLVIGTIHWKARDRLIQEISAREDAEIYKVTYENRGNLHEILVEKAVGFLEQA